MENTEWGQARAYVLESYPKAVCFKYRKNIFVIISDRSLIDGKCLSKDKTAINKGMAWIEAKAELEKEFLTNKSKNNIK